MVPGVGEPVSAEVLQALAHPQRLAILVALEAEPRTPADLAALLRSTEPILASHIATLRTVRLIDATPDGRLHATTGGWHEIATHLQMLQDGSAGTE